MTPLAEGGSFIAAGRIQVVSWHMSQHGSRTSSPSVTVVVPTYREAGSLPHLIERIGKVRIEHSMPLDVIIVDDNSMDGTRELIERLALPWVRLIVRERERGLSSAVVCGLNHAAGEVLVVMDADLSHPPEAIPSFMEKLAMGADFVIGSRYAPGGSTDSAWGWFRWLNSRVATLMARPLTSVRDPLSGFFALPRASLAKTSHLNPIGYKIGLELMVKCDCRNVMEVPIHFADRKHGESKLSFKEQLRYVQHLRRLLIHRHPNWSSLGQFAAVGASGTIVNLLVLTALLALGARLWLGSATGILVSMISNFVFNRRFTFSYARHGSIFKQFLGFMGSCGVGAGVQYAVTLGLHELLSSRGIAGDLAPQAAAMGGIMVGMAFNYLSNRFLVFRHAKPVARAETDRPGRSNDAAGSDVAS